MERRKDGRPMSSDHSALFIGVDAGGSKTAVAIADESLRILARGDGPGAAMRPGGGSRSAAVIAEIVRESARRAEVALPADRLVVGAAGAGREPERDQLVTALLACGLAREVRALGDVEAALTAAFHDGPGILVSAGTGSIAYARDAPSTPGKRARLCSPACSQRSASRTSTVWSAGRRTRRRRRWRRSLRTCS